MGFCVVIGVVLQTYAFDFS
uniref:Uncharacterized protein n=1 Tax=Anguilla anguilla TaxID=7936 RepID=A0A0E9UFL5_ANGAN